MHGASDNPSPALGRKPPRDSRPVGWRSARSRWVRVLVLALVICGQVAPLGQVAVRAAAPESPEAIQRRQSQMKFAYLYSFGVFTRWPAGAFDSTGGKFVIGVLGESPFGDDLNRIALTKKIQTKEIVLKKLSATEEPPTCHMVFFLGGVPAETERIVMEKLKGKPVLLVGEGKDFLNQGGVLRFFLDGAVVRFELSPTSAAKQQLTIDPRLAKLGQVQAKPHP
jgi:hypothetical protein